MTNLVALALTLRDRGARAARTHAHLRSVRETLEGQAATLTLEVQRLQAEQELLTHCDKGFAVLVDALAHESLGSVEQLLTWGLRTAFPDLALSCRLDVTHKRNGQWIDVILMDGNVQAPILDAFGGGPASVISFLLRLLVCRRTKLAPVILLDEAFSFVSTQYVPGVASLLRQLADKLGLTIVLVTHQPEFLNAAHVAYRISRTHEGAAVFTPETALGFVTSP